MKANLKPILFPILLLLAGTVSAYQTRNVIVVVIDGARYIETFGDSTHQNIPFMWNTLKPISTIFTRFYNDGITNTCPGHSAIVTGAWQNIQNDGSQRPFTPTIFEYYRKSFNAPQADCYVILGKPKLDILSYGNDETYGERYGASVIYCEDYTNDILTWNNIREVLANRHPRLAIVNLGQVDNRGHSADWEGYLSAIRQADSIVGLTWNLLQNDDFYRDRTTLFVTNDHGRTLEYFSDHGTQDEGSRHLLCLMAGPDCEKDKVDAQYRQQIDIAPTIGDLIGFPLPFTYGKTLLDIDPPGTSVPLFPVDNADLVPGEVLLQWTTAENAKSYHLELATDSTFSGSLLNDSTLSDTSRMVTHLKSGTTYYWRIRAKNSAGTGGWSATNLFTTKNIRQPEMTFIAPSDNSGHLAETLILRWKYDDSLVNQFKIQISSDSMFNNIIISDSLLASPEMLFDPPNADKRYWWRVSAKVTDEWTGWSSTRSFFIFTSLDSQVKIGFNLSLNNTSFSRTLYISFTTLGHQPFLLTIANLQGKSVQKMYSSTGYRGRYSAHIDLSDFPPGCYLASFSIGNFSITRKLVF